MKKIEVRCPGCNKKAAETPKIESIIDVICSRCHQSFTFNNGQSTIVKATDIKQIQKQKRFDSRRQGTSYQNSLNLRQK